MPSALVKVIAQLLDYPCLGFTTILVSVIYASPGHRTRVASTAQASPPDEKEMIVRKGFHISNFVPLVLAIKKLAEPLPDLRTCQQNTRDDLVDQILFHSRAHDFSACTLHRHN